VRRDFEREQKKTTTMTRRPKVRSDLHDIISSPDFTVGVKYWCIVQDDRLLVLANRIVEESAKREIVK
jgi:hypothetical protein